MPSRMIVAAVAYGVVAVSPFTIMPLLVGAMLGDLELSVKQAAYIVAAEMGGSGLAALLVSVFITRLNRRHIASGALSLFVVSNLLAAGVNDPDMLLSARLLAGVSAGTVVATVSAILAGTRTPERNFSLFFMGNLSFGVIAFLTLPSLIFAHWGLSGAYGLLAVLAAIVMVFFFSGLPAGHVGTQGRDDSSSSLFRPVAVSGLVGMLVYFIGVGALWPFVEQLGVVRDLAPDRIGLILGATQFSGIGGALLAAWLTIRFGRRLPIIAGTFVSLLAMMLFLVGTQLWSYALASVLFYFAYIFTLTYLAGVLAALDPAGRIAALGVTMQTAGSALGPAIAGEMITRGGYADLIWLTIFCLIVPLFFMMGATYKLHALNRL